MTRIIKGVFDYHRTIVLYKVSNQPAGALNTESYNSLLKSFIFTIFNIN